VQNFSRFVKIKTLKPDNTVSYKRITIFNEDLAKRKFFQKIRARINSINYLPARHYLNSLCGGNKSGAHGVYYKKNKLLGIKIIRSSENRKNGFKSLNKVASESNPCWRDAVKEFQILRQVSPSKITPLPYAVKPVKIFNMWHPAIFMEHIWGREILNYFKYNHISCEKCVKLENKVEKLAKILENKYGIKHCDYAGHNVIIQSRCNKKGHKKVTKIRIIDFAKIIDIKEWK